MLKQLSKCLTDTEQIFSQGTVKKSELLEYLLKRNKTTKRVSKQTIVTAIIIGLIKANKTKQKTIEAKESLT